MKKKKTSQMEFNFEEDDSSKKRKKLTPAQKEYLRKKRLTKLICFLERLEPDKQDPELF